MKDMANLKDSSSVDITSHKEELALRIKYDENDREVIMEKLKLCIDPLNTAGQTSALVNIVSGRICPGEVNVHDAVDRGQAQMEEYEASWPEGFHQPLKKRVHPMKECKKTTRIYTAEQFDSGLILARVLGLLNSRDVKVEQILSYELATVPASMSIYNNKNIEQNTQTSAATLKLVIVLFSNRKISSMEIPHLFL